MQTMYLYEIHTSSDLQESWSPWSLFKNIFFYLNVLLQLDPFIRPAVVFVLKPYATLHGSVKSYCT